MPSHSDSSIAIARRFVCSRFNRPSRFAFAMLALGSAALITACSSVSPTAALPMSCDDGIKSAFRPDALTRVEAAIFFLYTMAPPCRRRWAANSPHR